MNQLAFDLRDTPHCKMPPVGGQCYALLMAFYQGRRLTVLTAIRDLGIYALSQRCGDLRTKFGWPVQSRTIRTQSGKDISEYWMDFNEHH